MTIALIWALFIVSAFSPMHQISPQTHYYTRCKSMLTAISTEFEDLSIDDIPTGTKKPETAQRSKRKVPESIVEAHPAFKILKLVQSDHPPCR